MIGSYKSHTFIGRRFGVSNPVVVALISNFFGLVFQFCAVISRMVQMITAIFLVYRRPELSRQEFLDYWQKQHSALAVKHRASLGIRSFVQVHPSNNPMDEMVWLSRGGIGAAFDGIAEVVWDSVEAMAAVGQTEAELAKTILVDEARFVDLERSILFFGMPQQTVA